MFVPTNKDRWQRLMDAFYHEVALIEGEAKVFIDESFQSLRSAEGAFDMLLNFRHIKSRQAINKQMMNKFKDILLQYGKEVVLLFCRTAWVYHVTATTAATAAMTMMKIMMT